MMKYVTNATVAGIALAASFGIAMAQTGTKGPAGTGQQTGQQMSEAQCQTLWSTADSSKAGSLTQSQAQAYVSDFKSADSNNDGRLSSAEFQSACQKGMVRGTASSGSGTGSMGTGSGTAK